MSAIRNPATITSVGRRMMTAGGDITYTKAVLYGQDISHLTREQLESLTSIGNPLVTVPLGISDKNDNGNGTTVILEATFQNSNLKADLPYTAVGFFAKRGDDAEKLIAVGVATKGAYLAATSPDGVATDALDIKVAIAIGDSANVTAMIDPAGSVTPAALHNAITDVKSEMKTGLDTKADKSTVDSDVKSINDTLATKADKQTVTDDLVKKADKTDVDDQIGTVNKSVSDLSDTVKANKDDTDKTLATKADKATVESELSTKANQSDLDKTNSEVAKKADSEDVNAQLATKANSKDVNDALALKDDTADVDKKISNVSSSVSALSDTVTANKKATDTALDTKADKTALADYAKSADVNAELDKKADKTALDDYAKSSDVAADVQQLNDAIDTKADAKTVNDAIDKIDFSPYAKTVDVQAKLDTKANTTDLAPFARSVDVNKQIEGISTAVTNASNTEQADIDKINKALATKRDITDSYSKDELDKKFLQLSTDTGGKVDANQVATMIENKADKSDVTKQIGTITDLVNTKANSTDVDAALDKKDDTTDVDAKIKIVTDLANTKANSSDVYTKSAVDTAFSQRDSRIANVTNLANQIDSTRLPLYQGSANEDLKGFFTPQIRMYKSATGVKNIPADCQYQFNFYGTLVVLPDGASNIHDGSQILITPERKAWIAQSNGQGAKSWSDWSRFTLTSDLSAVQSALQAKIDAKADASNVYSKSEVDSKTTATIVTGYDIPSKTRQTMSAGVNVKLLVDPSVIDIVADQINQLKGRRTVDMPDFNTLTDGGTYYVKSPSMGKNYPTGAWGTLLVSNGSGHRISQLYFPDDSSAPWTRLLDETTWHNWIQLSTKQDVNNATNAANAASNKIDTVLANSYVRKQGMNANGDCVEIKHTGIKQANGGYAFDMWSDDWTASKLNDVIKKQLPSKADKSQVNTSNNLFNRMTDDSTWKTITGIDNTNNPVLTSLRDDSPTDGGNTIGGNGAGVAFGGGDTKGVLSVGWQTPHAVITGGNGTAPVWHEEIAWKSDINNVNNQINSTNQTVSTLQQTIKTLQDTLSSANATIKTLQDTITKQDTTITGLQTQVNNQAQDIAYIKANYIEGKRFSKADESQATAWEKGNSQRIAFITDN